MFFNSEKVKIITIMLTHNRSIYFLTVILRKCYIFYEVLYVYVINQPLIIFKNRLIFIIFIID